MTARPLTLVPDLHLSWCDVAQHEEDIRATGSRAENFFSAPVNIPAWQHREEPSTWITTTEDGARIFAEIGFDGLPWPADEAAVVGRILTEGTLEQLRAWGAVLVDLAQRVEESAPA